MTPETPGAKKRRFGGVLKTSAIVFVFLVAAKLLNFFKKILIGQLFGVSWVADAFFAASYFPYYLAIFFEGILFLGFLPLFSQILKEKGEEPGKEFVSEVLLLVAVATGLLTLLAWLGSGRFIQELVPGFSPEKQALSQALFQILTLVIIFTSLLSFFKSLNSYFEHYAFAASAGLADTIVMITITFFGWKTWGIYGAAWGAVLGAFAAMVLQAVFLFRKHRLWPKQIRIQSRWLWQLFYFLIPMAAIWGFQQIPFVILNRFGSGMWQGTISALTISHTLTTVPMGLVSHTVLFAIFPTLARQAGDKNPDHLRETFFQTLRGGFLILVPVGFLLTALARPLAVLFFQGGGIVEEGTQRIANSLACFGWATFALYADLFMTQSLIAIRKPVPAISLCASRAVLTYGLGYVLSTYWDYSGLAFSFSMAIVINLFLLFPFFFQWTPFKEGWGALFKYAAKLVLASIPIVLTGLIFNGWPVRLWMSFPKTLLVFALAGGFLGGGLIYLFLLFRLHLEEVRTLAGELKRGIEKRGWWLAEQTD